MMEKIDSMKEVKVKLSQLDEFCVFEIVKECLKHVFYMHGLMPSPLEDIYVKDKKNREEIQVDNKLRKEREVQHFRSRIARKECQLLKNFDDLFSILKSALTDLPGITCIAILLGSSFSRPKEMYCLHFEAIRKPTVVEEADDILTLANNGDGSLNEKTNKLQECTRKVIRALILAQLPFADRGPMNMHVVLRGPRGSIPPKGFIPKQGFTIHARRGMVAPVHIILQSPSNHEDMAPNYNSEDAIWFLYEAKVKCIYSVPG